MNKSDNRVALLKPTVFTYFRYYDAQSTNAILQSAKQREDLPKKHKNYRQLPLENQGRSYLADDDLLLKRIYSWLGKITANPSPTSSAH